MPAYSGSANWRIAGDSAVTTMYKHCHEPLPPLADFRPDCPPEVLETVTRMLAKDPAARWPSLESAVKKMGGATQSSLDPIRSQLLELASQPEGREQNHFDSICLEAQAAANDPFAAADAEGNRGLPAFEATPGTIVGVAPAGSTASHDYGR